MPDPIDIIPRILTHNQVTAISAVAPTGNEVVNVPYRKANVALINVKPSVVGATAKVKIWEYDSLLGWSPIEERDIPRPTYDNTYYTPLILNTKCKTIGITVTQLSSGNITISVGFASSDTV